MGSLDEVKERTKILRPAKAQILSQIDCYIGNALVGAYLVQDSAKQFKKLISELIKSAKNKRSRGNFKVDAVNFEIKGRDTRRIILCCPFGIEVHVSEFMFNRIMEKLGRKRLVGGAVCE
jgi:hypothetical protein